VELCVCWKNAGWSGDSGCVFVGRAPRCLKRRRYDAVELDGADVTVASE
jgi:hypothetical protein